MDDFEQLQLLGRGGYASVYLVRRINPPDLYALKRIPRSKIVTEQQKTRLEAEKFILLNVKSSFLCRGFETFETTEEVALLQEYMEGRALYECVWKYRDTGRFPENVTKFFAAQLVLALRDLHAEGYIHRDFKSGNVLVGSNGCAKVIDFGLSKRVLVDGEGGDRSERTLSMCGTHYIMAPEIFLSKEPHRFCSDWWSLGVIIFEMAVGHPPWGYQCSTNSTMEEYFQRIKQNARSPLQTLDGDFQIVTNSLSSDLQSLICELLTINPHKRLGRNGSDELMNHPWFNDMEWEKLENKESLQISPYNFEKDYNPARVRTFLGQNGSRESLSSAESIDPEDNAKYFADF